MKSFRKIIPENGIVFLKSDNIYPGSAIILPDGKRGIILPDKCLKEMEEVLRAKDRKQEERI